MSTFRIRSALLVGTLLASTVSAVAIVSPMTSDAATVAPRATAHLEIEADLCDVVKIAKDVRSFPHLTRAACTYTPPRNNEAGCIISGGNWDEAQLGIRVDVYNRCTRKGLDDVEAAAEEEDQSGPGNSSLGLGIFSTGYWNEQYGQGETVIESKHHILTVIDITDPYVKLGNTNGYTPAPDQIEFAELVNSIA